MSIMRMVLFLAVAGLAYQYWTKQQQTPTGTETGPAVVVSAKPSPNGFLPLPALEGAGPNQIVVFAPENCPSEDAQRADSLARELASRNIPSRRSHDVSFTANDPDPAIGQRLNAVMSGQLPIVFVNGRGRANPTLEQVLAEFSATP